MATDRLRRKLRDVEQSDVTGLQQDFCGIGTPLPALDARKKDANELKPIWQQEARDEQGRRRFHGAFTGGFSAGYFNTVGSKEGWKPSSFRSSRADKANGVAAQTTKVRPEDFMDEEDLQDRKQTQQIQTSTAFAGPSSETHDPFLGRLGASRENDVAMLASALYQQMNPAQKETLGYQLLKRMGWKEGQGLGARLDAAKRRRLLRHLQGETPASLDDEGIIEAERKHLFAPPKTDVPRLEERQDRHGLGWMPGTNLRQSAPQQHNAPREGFSSQNDVLLPSIRSAAQPDSDEEDPFGDDGVAPVMESARLPMRQLREPVQARTAPTSGEKETWRDGREMLSGFRLSSTNAPATATHTPETLPEGWTPDPARVAELLQAATLNSGENATLSPTARGQLLGEAKLPGPPPRMPAFLVQKAQKATVHKDEWVDVPRTDAATATLALQGFMPYSNEPDKQKQYRSYLESQLEPAEEQASRQLVPADSSAEQFSVLLKEFANKAAISRLMSSTMANRFTSASAVPSAQDRAFLEPGLWQPGSMPQVQAEEPVVDATPAIEVSESPKVDDKADASTKWNKNAKGRQPKLSVDQHWLQNKEQLKAMVASAPLAKASSGRGTERASPNELLGEPIDQLGLGDDQRQGQDTLSYIKPTMDVFKAIFESDDEDSEGEEAHKPQSDARKSKIRDPTLAASVTFQARSKRKDGSEPIKVQSTDKKRKKDKAAKKGGMLSFDLEEGADTQPAKPNKTAQQPQPQGAKNRVKASDLF